MENEQKQPASSSPDKGNQSETNPANQVSANSSGGSEAVPPVAAQPPSPAPAQDTDEDATTGEIIRYALGGVAGSFAGSSVTLIGPILMLVFKVNALLLGLISSINLIVDAFADTIMASITDNFHSKWGRRRPFILVGGVLLPLVSIIGWMYLPRNSRVEPNVSVIPAVESSEAMIKSFGNMLVAYNLGKPTVYVRPVENATGKPLPSTLDDILKRAVGKVNATLVPSETGGGGASPDIVLMTKITEVSDEVTEEIAPIGFHLTFSMQAVDKHGKKVGGTPVRVEVGPKLELKEPKKTFAQKLNTWARRETNRVGLSCTGEGLRYQINIERERSRHRAVVSALEVSMVRLLGERLQVPFWRCFPEGSHVEDEIKNRVRQSLPQAPQEYMPRLKTLVYASGRNVDLKSTDWSPADWEDVEQMRKESNSSDPRALYSHLWENLALDKGEARLRLFKNPPKPKQEASLWKQISAGVNALKESSREDRRIVFYVLVFLLVKSLVRTVFGVPYYALGIELAPSYHGRTKVVAWRSIFEKIIAFKNPWLMPICLLPFFADAAKGAFFLSIVFAVIAIPMVIAATVKTKERSHVDKRRKKVPFFKSIKMTINNRHFWKVTGLYILIPSSVSVFNVVGTFVTTYYVFRGDLLLGSMYLGILGSFGIAVAMFSVPFITWMCKNYQKHNALRAAIILMMVGCVLKWWCYNPDYPELIFIQAIFYSLGISSMYTVLSTLMADVTDVDELLTGTRREGMFGAVSSWVMKTIGTVTSIAAGLLVVISGFDVNLGVHQAPGVFTTMRIMFSIIPGTLLTLSLLLLYKYPLTETRMKEIKEQLRLRRQAQAAGAA